MSKSGSRMGPREKWFFKKIALSIQIGILSNQESSLQIKFSIKSSDHQALRVSPIYFRRRNAIPL